MTLRERRSLSCRRAALPGLFVAAALAALALLPPPSAAEAAVAPPAAARADAGRADAGPGDAAATEPRRDGPGGAPGPVVGAPARGAASPDTLTLSEALRLSLERSPRIAAGRAAISAEDAGLWADWGSLLPRVVGGLDFARLDATRLTFEGEEGESRVLAAPISFVRKGSWQYLDLSWGLVEAGRGIFRIQEGGARRQAARARLTRREREVVAGVKRAYFEALEQQELTDVARRQLEARREELEVTRHRREVGSAERADLLGARLEEGRARLRLLDARRRAAAALRELRREVGVQRDEELPLDRLAKVSVPEPGALDSAALVRRAVDTDPEVRALAADLEAASAAARRAWTRYLPDVQVYYSLWSSEVGGPGNSFFNLDPSDDFEEIGVSVSWDLFEGFERREATARASAAAEDARAARRSRRLELETEVGNRVGEIRRRHQRLEVLGQNVEYARERLRLARLRYEAARMDFRELQAYIDDLTAAQEALVGERYDYLTAWAELEALAGEVR